MKRQRQNKILEIINNNIIDTQDALIEKLKEEGYDVTQATASRDIRELNLTKVALGGGVYKYAESHKDDVKISVKYKNILNETLVKADFACNMIVLKTYAGMANAAAAAVDNMGWDDIVGSIAGDDTVLIIMRSEESAKDFYDKFNELIKR